MSVACFLHNITDDSVMAAFYVNRAYILHIIALRECNMKQYWYVA